MVSSADASKEKDKQDSYRKIDELQRYLTKNIKELKRNGVGIMSLTIMLAFGIYFDIKNSLIAQLESINTSPSPTQTVTYLIFRSTALGAIATTILVFGTKLSISCFDQSMRFTKRNMATYFLNFLYKQHNEHLGDNVTIDQIMNAFENWNGNVGSAFTNSPEEKNSRITEKSTNRKPAKNKKIKVSEITPA